MKKILCCPLCSLLYLNLYAMDLVKVAKGIADEGKILYRLEMASWYGTDIFLEHYNNQSDIGGYFSYIQGDSAKCIFFSREENPIMLGIVTFDSTYTINKASIELKTRAFNDYENHLFQIRQKALTEIYSDSLFLTYLNTDLNLIPLMYKGERKVYVLTGPKESGVVIFGNDYLLTFDENNNLQSKKMLHRNIIPIRYNDESQNVTMHSHLPETGDFITPTDICTLMLYEKFAGWKRHLVISENYVSIWDCDSNKLIIKTKEEFGEIKYK
ncbi:MAG: hypothetical protein ACLVKO_08325 [Dysgonomonas sp.]